MWFVPINREKLHNEVTEVSKDVKQINNVFIGKMEYLDACMKETVRKYSILQLVRISQRPFEFTAGNIPKSTNGRVVLL